MNRHLDESMELNPLCRLPDNAFEIYTSMKGNIGRGSTESNVYVETEAFELISLMQVFN